jgi:predicted phage tail protein
MAADSCESFMMLSGTWLRTNRFGGAAAGFAGATSEEVVASFGCSIVVGGAAGVIRPCAPKSLGHFLGAYKTSEHRTRRWWVA